MSWLSMGWVGLVGLGWVGLGRGSETFPKILKLGRPLVTAEVIPDNLIMINADNWVIHDKLLLTVKNCFKIIVFIVPEGLLLVVWSLIGLWVWVGLWVQRFYCAMGLVGSGWRNWTHWQVFPLAIFPFKFPLQQLQNISSTGTSQLTIIYYHFFHIYRVDCIRYNTGLGWCSNPGVFLVIAVLGRTHHSRQLQQVRQRLCQVTHA